MLKTIIAAAVAAIAAAAPALADEEVTTAAGTQVNGTFQFPRQAQHYPVDLIGGHDYAVMGFLGIDEYANAFQLTVRKSGGGRVASGMITGGSAKGFEFRAPSSGRYLLDAAETASAGYPNPYLLQVMADCRGDASTQCVLKPGAVKSKVILWPQDEDWFRMDLRAGRPHRIVVTSGCVDIRVVDARGAPLSASADSCGEPSAPVAVDFAPRRAGTYYLKVAGVDADHSRAGYVVTLDPAP